jgi:hypothetical protein
MSVALAATVQIRNGVTVEYLAPLLLGTAIILPAPGHNAMTLGPDGTTFTFRGENGNSIILSPDGGTTFDFDNGGGNHITLEPGEPPIFTFGDGEDDE